jgi:hypothetical protein
MADFNAGQSPTDRYQARLMIAAWTKCRDQDEAAKLFAQYIALAPRIQQAIDQAGDYSDSGQHRQAITLLGEIVARVEQFTSPYPVEAVRDVFGYDLARLYFVRAATSFGGSSRSADPMAALNAALTDLDRAQSYPRACFAELNPELPDKMSELRTIVRTVMKSHETKPSGNTSVTKSSGCMTLIAACGLVGLLGVMLM